MFFQGREGCCLYFVYLLIRISIVDPYRIGIRAVNLGVGETMAQKRIEERLEATDKEIKDIKLSVQKLPLMDETLTALAKSNERLTVQVEKQQHCDEVRRFIAAYVTGHPPGDLPLPNRFSVDRKLTEGTRETLVLLPHLGFDEGGSDLSKFKKVDMPVFSGTDLDSWLFCADRYFKIHRLSDEEKLTVAVISFESAALNWYCATEERELFRSR